MTDEFNSPYRSPASFSLNPYFIDLDILFERGYLTKDELSRARQKNEYRCEFEKLSSERLPLLFTLARRAMADSGVRDAVEKFILKNPRIGALAKFLSQRYQVTAEPCEAEGLWQFLHYEFFTEWQAIKSYANQRGIEIMGDLPMYVSPDGADVWENPSLFLLDESGYPTRLAGVPPDYFSPVGQLWGNPIYNYRAMRADNFSWWRERVNFAFSLFDSVRIDHFRAFSAYYSIERGKTACEGVWKRGAGAPLVSAITRESCGRTLIAEDLGVIDGAVGRLRDKFSIPGMRVFQFGFIDGTDSEHLPHNYINSLVAYTGTHDNNTLLGFLFEAPSEVRARIFKYCGYFGTDIDESIPFIIRTMLSSSAGTVIFPIQDILGHGSDTRMNTPSVASGNWGYRITKAQLDSIDRRGIRELMGIYKRL